MSRAAARKSRLYLILVLGGSSPERAAYHASRKLTRRGHLRWVRGPHSGRAIDGAVS